MQHYPGFLKLVEDTRPLVPELSIDQTRARQEADPSVILVDVREDREWDAGHIAGAVHLGKGIIERDIEAHVPDKSAELILYCGGGYRSVLAAEVLQRMGYENVASMAGGWREWNAAGYPVAKPC